jgi:hypothetical protein
MFYIYQNPNKNKIEKDKYYVEREEFNIKYSSFLEEGFPGLVIEDTRFINQLDKFFEEVTKIKEFKYYKISEGNHLTLVMKTNISRILPVLGWIIESKMEEDLSYILDIEKQVRKRIKEIENEKSTGI